MTFNIKLPAKLEKFVSDQLRSGRFNSPTDLVYAGLRLLEREQMRKSFSFSTREELAEKLVQGFDSGPAAPMTKERWKELRARVLGSVKENQS